MIVATHQNLSSHRTLSSTSMPSKNKKKTKPKRATPVSEPTRTKPTTNVNEDDEDDDEGIPALEPASFSTKTNSRTGLSPELESVHLSTTASLAAMAATPELGKTAQDLYRGLDKDMMNIPEDSEYWLSLPPTIKSFVQNAYAHGMFPSGGSVGGELHKDQPAMYTAAQQMIANGQQLKGGRAATPPYPPGAYPALPPFDASVFSDPAFTQALEQLMPRPDSRSVGGQGQSPSQRLQTDFEVGEEYYSEEEDDADLDLSAANGRDGYARSTANQDIGSRKTAMSHPMPPTPLVAPPKSSKVSDPDKRTPKKPPKSTISVPPTPSLPPPVPNPPPLPQSKQAPIQSKAPPLAPPSRPAPIPNHVLTPSPRAVGKQPMSYPQSSPNPPRSARAHGKAPASAPAPTSNHYHHHPSPPSSTKAAPTKPRPPATAGTKKGDSKIWNTSSSEDRERIRDFWLSLTEDERRNLVRLEKDAVLKKMKEQQRHSCSCAVCGRKRTAIEEELEVLYDAYYEELEVYANQQQQYATSPGTVPPPLGPGPFPGSVEFDQNGDVIPNPLTKHPAPPIHTDDDYDEEEDDYEEDGSEEGSDEEEEEEEAEAVPASYPKGAARRSNPLGRGQVRQGQNGNSRQRGNASPQDFFTFGPSLTVAGNILTVADDLLKNDGTKFLEMMEQLATRRAYREDISAGAVMDDESDEEDEGSGLESGSDEDDEDDEDDMSEEQKMEEGRRMFSIFAARMFEQRVLNAYRERVAQDRQKQLLKELEEESRLAADREAKKARDNQKKKEKKRQQKLAKEEEAARKAREKAQQEAEEKARKAAQDEENRRKREEDRLKKEADKRAREEERLIREMERRKRVADEKEREREREAERKKKEREERERERERLKKEREERERAERERHKKLEAERAAAEAERQREAESKREKEEKERQEREALAAKQAAEDKASAAVAAPTPAKASVSAVTTASPSFSNTRNTLRPNGSSQMQTKKSSAPKTSTAPLSTTVAPSGSRPSPAPSAIPLQSATSQSRPPPAQPTPIGPPGRRATAPMLSSSPQMGQGSQPVLPSHPSFTAASSVFTPPSPAAMSFNNAQVPFGVQGPPQSAPALQPSAVPRGFGQGLSSSPMDFHSPLPAQSAQQAQTPFPTMPQPPIGPPSSARGNPSPGPAQLMSPGSLPPGPIGSGFSPSSGVPTHSRRSSLDPIGSRPAPSFGAITRPIAPIGTRPIGSSAAPLTGTPSLAAGTAITLNGIYMPGASSSKLDGEELRGSPIRKAESPERLGSSALVDPTDEPIPSTSRRGTYWSNDIPKSPDALGSRSFASGQWGSFNLTSPPGNGAIPPLPPPSSQWGMGSAIASGNGWPTGNQRGSFNPVTAPPGIVGPSPGEGQCKTLTLWISDQNPDRVVLNHESWPGVASGDIIQVQSAVSAARKEAMSTFCFIVGKDEGAKYGSLQQITIPKHLATVFNLQNRSEVLLTKVNKESVTADSVEIYFRDQYLGRCDMWRLGESLEEQCIHVEERVTFAGCIHATIKALYVKNRRVSSAYITSKTKMIYRSMSAKTTIFIQVCQELWDFSDDGERYYEKICHFFLPALFERWQSLGTTHVVTIVLISRVFYDESEKEYAAGPLRQDSDSGQWYKDFYKVIVDLEVVHDWKPSLVYLKESFWTFQRDILLTHHYHQNIKAREKLEVDDDGDSMDDPPVRLVGRISMAHEGPILEALNLSLNPMESHYVDRSLVLTGCSMMLLSPGTGHFRVNKRLLQLTTTRMLDQGFGLDLVCLSKAPLHRSPVFSFWGAEPGTNESIPGLRDTDPLWVWEEEDGPLPGIGTRRRTAPQIKKRLYWEPFWVSVSFWDQQNNMPFREDRFVPRARMYEIQMLGLLAHDVSTLAIPYMDDHDGLKIPPTIPDGQSPHDAIKLARQQYDNDVFASRGKDKSSNMPRITTTLSTAITATRGPSPQMPEYRSQFASNRISEERPTLSTASSTSSMATTLATFNSNPKPIRVRSPGPKETTVVDDPVPTPISTTPKRSESPSQLSVRSTSTTSTKESKRRSTRAGTFTSKFGVGQWLIASITGRSGPSQAEASQVSISRSDVGRPAVATPTPVPPRPGPVIQQPSPVKPQPIAIKSTGHAPRRTAQGIRNDDTIQQVGATPGRPRSYVSPISSSPIQDAVHVNAPQTRRTVPLEVIATPPINPSRPMSVLSPSQSSLARRWQHIFPHPTLQHQIKWKSICTPACLPLTTEYYPSKTELEKAYQVYSYDVLVTPDVHASFMLKRTGKTIEEDEWPLLVMRHMAALRLALGFQFVVAPSSPPTSATGFWGGNTDTLGAGRFAISGSGSTAVHRHSAPTHPVGASEFFKTINDYAYLSMSNQIHRISFNPVEQVIQVSRYVRRTTHSLDPVHYSCLVWPRLGDGYREAAATFSYPNLDMYGWNRMDMLVAGYEHDLAETLRYWRTRFVVIPSEQPPTFNQISGLSDEEIRLLGTDKLAELFQRARWYKPHEKPDDFAPVRFLPTTLGPSACVLDEWLMSQLDEVHAQGPLRKKRNSTKTVEDTPLTALAKAMREEDGVPMKDNTWHRVVYPDSFTGYDFVSWLVREYKDVSTREQGTTWGIRLMQQGLIEHCRGTHGFLDGHYYYRLKDEYAVAKPQKGPKWFRSSPVTYTGTEGTPKKMRRQMVLSQTMIIDVDPTGRSKQAETAILHHDIIHNPNTAFHFELNWMGTTARFIDDIVHTWGRAIEKYGLRLVEAYVDPIVDIQQKNVFQSTFPIRLTVPPPVVPNLAKRLPDGTLEEHFFEHCILKHFGYILDIEADSRYSDTVDVAYSYRRSSFRETQWVHKSGLAFVQVIGGSEGFKWLTNRLAGTSNNLSGHGWSSSTSGGITSAGGRTSASGSMAPPMMLYERNEKERVPTSVLIQRQLKGLSEFCSDAERLRGFYHSVMASLPSDPDA
ncbi:vacuolar membrane-associated protein iml1 [Tulasnella sp. 403]|nr:vacuolar membrane-associated protein iml1 [Tulasnella sp. 403]